MDEKSQDVTHSGIVLQRTLTQPRSSDAFQIAVISPMRLVVIALSAVVMTSSACSMLLMEKPSSSWKPPTPTHCSASMAPQAIDGTIGLLSMAAGMLAITQTQDSDNETAGLVIGISGIVEGALWIASGVKGHGWATECKERRELEAQHASDPAPQ